jgi:drug/metabolite transporter (DMT)-like permease
LNAAARSGIVALCAVCVLAVVAFVGAKAGKHQELWMGTSLAAYVAGLAAALGWALAPAFQSPEGLRVPPLALAVFVAVLCAGFVSWYLLFTFWLTFGGHL